MSALVRHRVRSNSSNPVPEHIRAQGILIYKRRASIETPSTPDCCWLTGYAESNGLAGRLLPQKEGGYRALKWRDRGGYVDLGVFPDMAHGIKALGTPKKF